MSKMLPNASACSVCGDREHISAKCPTLHSPLTPGFYTGGGGGGGHSHDDDDEKITLTFLFRKYNTHGSVRIPSCTWSETFHKRDKAYCP
jgi:hypothetical protein